MRFPTRRHFLALSGAAATAPLLAPRASRAQNTKLKPLRIGVAVPAMTGLAAVRTSITDYVGEGARMGAIMAEAKIGELAEKRGWFLSMAHANTPSVEAARRSATRLVEHDKVCALIGGIGPGQAEAMSRIAADARIPFFNVGSMRDALRQSECNRYTFHVEASAAMYLDALTSLPDARARKKWFVLHEANDDGRALNARAAKALAKQGNGSSIVGSAAVTIEQPVYYNEFNAAKKAGAEAFLLLISPVDQIAFIGQVEPLAPEIKIFVFPHPIAQTRDYISTARNMVPEISRRLMLWETTNKTGPAGVFNDMFLTRWGQATDPTAWSAYHSVKMLFEAITATGTLDSAALIAYFENPKTVLDLAKGPGTSFRPWDHQLRQPLYTIEVDQDLEWVRTDVATWIGLAKLDTEIPGPGADPIARLDQLGDGPGGACRL